MNFRTEISIPNNSLAWIDHNSNIFTIGSCFAEEIGKKLQNSFFSCLINPFGAIYNPLNINVKFREILGDKQLNEKDFICDLNNIWHHWDYHSRFSSISKIDLRVNIEEQLSKCKSFLQRDNLIVIITLGSSICYSLESTGKIVSNCHKFPPALFRQQEIDIKNITDSLWDTIKIIKNINPDSKIIITVSPIRHKAYGLHRDKLSKARLLLACDKICSKSDDISYFPAYEIMMDDLRDYRFYARDMIHPSEIAIDYIYDIFTYFYMNSNERSFNNDCISLFKLLQHRPLNFDDKQTIDSKIKDKIRQLSLKYPGMEESIKQMCKLS